MLGSDDAAQEIIRRFDSAVALRGTLDAHCEEIARRVIPNYAGSFTSRGVTRTQGEKRTEDMVDATAALALPKFASVMESMLTPRASRWQRLVPTDRSLIKNRQVALWFEQATDILFQYRYAPQANYASQKYESYLALGAFGTGCLFTDKLVGGGLRFRAVHLAEVYFLENHQGLIDTAFRKFPLTARQAKQQFGLERLPDQVKQALASDKTSDHDKQFWFIHCVKPRADYDPNRKDFKGMAFTSEYVSVEGKSIVKEEGYNSFPYSISRYVQAPGEVYGRSPAMLVLPSIKVLNEQKKTVLKQGHRAVDPVLLAHDDGVADAFSMKPGAINYGGVSADGRPLVHALPVGNLTLAKEMMEAERMAINDAFLITLFQILVETPQMTATEVVERAREKGMLLSPTMGRQMSEALGPETERAVDLLSMQGLLPPMPQMLREARGEFQIEYDSPMARQQKAENVAGLFRTVDWLTSVFNVTQDRSIFDPIDFDAAVPDILDNQSVPVRWQRSADAIKALRDDRNKAAASQQAIDALPGVGGLAKAVGAGAA